MNVLLPINIDRWRSSIATQLRAVVEANPDLNFTSFSSPTSEEDRVKGRDFWRLPQIRKANQATALTGRYDIVQLAAISQKNMLAARIARWRGMGSTKIVSILCLEIVPEDVCSWRNYQRLLPLPDYFLSVSRAAGALPMKDAPERYKGVIPNGFDEVFFDPSLVDGHELPDEVKRLEGRPFLLYVSSLEARKRTDFLIRMARRMPDVTFVAAGFVIPGEGEPYLDEISVQPNILWLGLVEKRVLRELYRAASALFFPSAREGMPLAIIEAFGMGLPVIAQPRSSMPDLVKPGINGDLIDCEDEDGWESAARRYLDWPESGRIEFQQGIRQWAIENHSWNKVGQLYGRFYKAVRDGKTDTWQQ